MCMLHVVSSAEMNLSILQEPSVIYETRSLIESRNLSLDYTNSPASPESACFLRAGITGMPHMPILFIWVLELNSYPHAYMASMLLTEPAPSPFHYFVKSVCV